MGEFKSGEKSFQNHQEDDSDKDDNQLINLFVKFVHPLDGLSEFDQFKFIFYQNNYPIASLPSDLKESIKLILET